VGEFDLKAYLNCFSTMCQARFGRTFDFSALERDCRPLGTGERHLSARDIAKMLEPTRTPFASYWKAPDPKRLDVQLSKLRIMLGPFASNDEERKRIIALLPILQSIGLISICFRFADPQNFGVFSTPVISALSVQRPNTADTYLAYCEELRRWRDHFKMNTVADTETALWAYQHLANDPNPKIAEQHLCVFQNDVWVQRRRVAQTVGPFLREFGSLELASILVYEDPNLAGKIVAEEYESRLLVARAKYCPKLKQQRGWAETLLDTLVAANVIQPAQKLALDEVWDLRNKSVHAEGIPTAEEVEKMIRVVRECCAEWAQSGKLARAAH